MRKSSARRAAAREVGARDVAAPADVDATGAGAARHVPAPVAVAAELAAREPTSPDAASLEAGPDEASPARASGETTHTPVQPRAARRPRARTRPAAAEVVVHEAASILVRDPLEDAVAALARELPERDRGIEQKREITVLRRRVRALERDLTERDGALAKAHARLAALEQSAEERAARQSALERDRTELRRALIHATTTLGLRDDDLLRLRAELARVEEERDEHARRLDDAAVLQRALHEEMETLRRASEDVETDRTLRRTMEGELARLRDALSTLQDASSRRDGEIAELRQLLDAERNAIAIREQELARTRAALQRARGTIEGLEAERAREIEARGERESEHEALRASMARARALLDETLASAVPSAGSPGLAHDRAELAPSRETDIAAPATPPAPASEPERAPEPSSQLEPPLVELPAPPTGLAPPLAEPLAVPSQIETAPSHAPAPLRDAPASRPSEDAVWPAPPPPEAALAQSEREVAPASSVAAQLLARFVETPDSAPGELPEEDELGVTLARSLVRARAAVAPGDVEPEGVTPPRRHPRPEVLARRDEEEAAALRAELASAQSSVDSGEGELPVAAHADDSAAIDDDVAGEEAGEPAARGSLWRRLSSRIGLARGRAAAAPALAVAPRPRLVSTVPSAAHAASLALGGPDLPAFAHWVTKHVRPMLEACAIESPDAIFLDPLVARCAASPGRVVRVLSLGAGTGELEVHVAAMARAEGVSNFRIECLNIEPDRLLPGRERAAVRHTGEHVSFSRLPIARGLGDGPWDLVFAVDVLHRLRALESTLDQLVETLAPDASLVTVERIGLNRHVRSPEARELAERIWRLVPESHRVDARTGVVVESFADVVPADADDGVRAEDVLRSLMRRFHAETFVAFGNVIEAFVNERFGAGIDPEREDDRRFLDRLAEIDHARIDAGALRPTRMVAIWRTAPVVRTRCWRERTPERCAGREGARA